MGVLYNVLFRNGGGSGMGCVEPTTTTTDQPEWVLDRRDGGSLVWRRSGSASSRHVKFLDEVQVKEYERDEYDDAANSDTDSDGDVDDFLTTSSWSTDTATDDCRLLCDGKLAAAAADDTDTVVLIMSCTVLGLCIGLAYLFTPVNWLLHQLID